jgi:N-methylhydantoinase A/oxoprolinase/acetone carboxylase beta subunit
VIRLGIDAGGTFTDFVFWRDGELRVHKVLSTPTAPEIAILQGIAGLGLEAAGLKVIHGSTVATNACEAEAPVLPRGDLHPGRRIAGPAIVTDPVAATWLAPGWEAVADPYGNLLLSPARTGLPGSRRRVRAGQRPVGATSKNTYGLVRGLRLDWRVF